jgi:hypothetical protein
MMTGKPMQAPVMIDQVHDLQSKMEAMHQSLSKLSRSTPADLRKVMMHLFETNDFSPAEELISMALGRECRDGRTYELTADQRVRILSELNSYVMPKLRSVEVKGEVEHKHRVVIVRYGDDGNTRQEEMAAPKQRDAIDVIATPSPPE